jgi:hypothetical protein
MVGKTCPTARCVPFDEPKPRAQEGRDKENNDTPSFSEFVRKRIEPSLHWTSTECRTRGEESAGRCLSPWLCSGLRLRLHWSLHLRLIGCLHRMILLNPPCRLRLRVGRHLEIGRVRRLHLRLLLDHPLLLQWRHVGRLWRHVSHLRRSRLVLLRRHRPHFRRSPLQFEVCLRQSTRCAKERGLQWYDQQGTLVVRDRYWAGESYQEIQTIIALDGKSPPDRVPVHVGGNTSHVAAP